MDILKKSMGKSLKLSYIVILWFLVNFPLLIQSHIFTRKTDDGSNVNVYVVDTGIWNTHNDFGGRGSIFYDALDGDVSYL